MPGWIGLRLHTAPRFALAPLVVTPRIAPLVHLYGSRITRVRGSCRLPYWLPAQRAALLTHTHTTHAYGYGWLYTCYTIHFSLWLVGITPPASATLTRLYMPFAVGLRLPLYTRFSTRATHTPYAHGSFAYHTCYTLYRFAPTHLFCCALPDYWVHPWILAVTFTGLPRLCHTRLQRVNLFLLTPVANIHSGYRLPGSFWVASLYHPTHVTCNRAARVTYIPRSRWLRCRIHHYAPVCRLYYRSFLYRATRTFAGSPRCNGIQRCCLCWLRLFTAGCSSLLVIPGCTPCLPGSYSYLLAYIPSCAHLPTAVQHGLRFGYCFTRLGYTVRCCPVGYCPGLHTDLLRFTAVAPVLCTVTFTAFFTHLPHTRGYRYAGCALPLLDYLPLPQLLVTLPFVHAGLVGLHTTGAFGFAVTLLVGYYADCHGWLRLRFRARLHTTHTAVAAFTRLPLPLDWVLACLWVGTFTSWFLYGLPHALCTRGFAVALFPCRPHGLHYTGYVRLQHAYARLDALLPAT